MGFNTSVRYKQFTLSAVADYKTGHKYYNNLVDALEFTGSTQHSTSAGREPFVFPNSVYEYTPGYGLKILILLHLMVVIILDKYL